MKLPKFKLCSHARAKIKQRCSRNPPPTQQMHPAHELTSVLPPATAHPANRSTTSETNVLQLQSEQGMEPDCDNANVYITPMVVSDRLAQEEHAGNLETSSRFTGPIDLPVASEDHKTAETSTMQPIPAPNSSQNQDSSCEIPPVAPSPHAHRRWTELSALMNLLTTSVSKFGPFAAALEAMAACAQVFEETSRRRKDYEELGNKLNSLVVELRGLFDDTTSPVVTLSMSNLAENIKQEMVHIQERCRQLGGVGHRIVTKEDEDEVLECYRRVEEHLERLKLNANVKSWAAIEEQITESRLSRLPNSRSAKYRSAGPEREGCMANTRVSVLHELSDWTHNSKGKKIYWLNGMAGTGKTSIACSLCNFLEEEYMLAASFFCSRQLPECRDVDRIIPTIAYQLARYSLPFCRMLCNTIKSKPDADNQPLNNQFVDLIVNPLKAVQSVLPDGLVIVIDALDECNDHGGSKLMEVVLSHAEQLPLKLFVTSRPDQRIVNRMEDRKQERAELHLHKLEALTVQGDIRTYITARLKPYVMVTDAEIEVLVKRSGVLFIYAATVVRYITSDTRRRGQRLKRILYVSDDRSNEYEGRIDELYMAILQLSFDNPDLTKADRVEMKLVLDTIVCAREPLSAGTLADLLQLESDDSVEAAIGSFLSVLQVSPQFRTIATLHESFPEFMLDQRRSGAFYCNPHLQHAELAGRCFDQIERVEPRHNICRLESSYSFDSDVGDLQDRIEKYISKSLSYACCYWVSHSRRAANVSEIRKQVTKLLSERLLLWAEVMNLIGRIRDGVRQLYIVYAFLKSTSRTHLGSSELAQDAYRFVLSFASNPTQFSTPHIYVSTLYLWPRESAVGRCYAQWNQRIINPRTTALISRRRTPIAAFQIGSSVAAAKFSPDGVYLACGLGDGTLRIGQVHTGHPRCEPLRGHTGYVTSMAYSPNGAHIVSGSADNTVRIWNAQTGKARGQPLQGHTDQITSVSYSSDGTYIASGSRDKTIHIWDAHTGQAMGQPLWGHTNWITSVAYSPDSRHIVSGSADNTLRIWNTHVGKVVGQPLQGHNAMINSVAYSPDGVRVVSGSADSTLCVWDTQTGQVLRRLIQGLTNWVTCVAYSPDGIHVLSGFADSTIRIWNVQTGKARGQPLQGHTDQVLSVEYSPDGAYIVSGSRDKTVCIWDVHTGKTTTQLLPGHNHLVRSVAYSPDGTRVASGSQDGMIHIWDTCTGQAVGQQLQGHIGPVNTISYSPDGGHIVSGSDDSTLRIWDMCTGQAAGNPLQSHTGPITTVAYSPNGANIASGSSDETICLWNVLTCKPTKQLKSHTDWVMSVSYSPDGVYIVSGSRDKTICMWDTSTGQVLWQSLQGHTNWVTCVACSSDGAHVVSGSADNTLQIWDVQTGRTTGEPLRGHTEPVTCAVYSPDGAYIVSGSADNTLRIWDTRTSRAVGRPLHGHVSRVNSVNYSLDSMQFASGSDDRTIRIWNALTPASAGLQSWDNTKHDHSTNPLVENSHNVHGSPQILSHLCSSGCRISGVHRPWTVNEDGWVLDDSQLLIWVPPDLQPQLVMPQNLRLITQHGELWLEFDNNKIGNQWDRLFLNA